MVKEVKGLVEAIAIAGGSLIGLSGVIMKCGGVK